MAKTFTLSLGAILAGAAALLIVAMLLVSSPRPGSFVDRIMPGGAPLFDGRPAGLPQPGRGGVAYPPGPPPPGWGGPPQHTVLPHLR